ncbi:DUF5718 family protein [Helicobacter mustelae]|uniref:Valyl-tRNA synthetase n=1 Tax=Helicobacter mustelae (strain ATCC 43772 / CCUG 25715 / CIP 103759 / LMG 18044 / NCTC 12198 / R85-136P) TaxID=679897 RepID=D3UFM6_HELM1|nr:DUF5718 family protein [Helicobacter mustelae]CBG39297.1 Conserved hypothetical protein [Helicobacter mustelae 12198]SQH70808.1 valyl-tRNA synthetase [Helicobacter mustelae]STP11933.1 valyl-tRNA synthetase [Helicobacter mustelae]
MKHLLGIGIAGNFANHLEQAGEADGFCNIAIDDEDGPKGIFPFYIPGHERLGRDCFDNHQLVLPQDPSLNVQAESEVGLECEIIYEGDEVVDLHPKFFMAFNDASVRNDKKATKISQKKNFSPGCKGYGSKIPIDKFESGGICDHFSIASFIEIDGAVHAYGECSPLTGYSYFYKRLICWLVNKLNNQKDEFILESFKDLVFKHQKPKTCIIAIGATKYTELGEKRFLHDGDKIFIAVFHNQKYTQQQIQNFFASKEFPKDEGNLSFIVQEVVKN